MSGTTKLELTDGDRISLGIVFAVAMALSLGIGHMFLSAWQNGAWRPLHAALSSVGVDPVLATQFIAMVTAGWFLGLVGLMYNDERKQIQATLLASTPIIAIGVMVQSGYGGFFFDSIPLNLVGIIIGGALSIGFVGYLGDLDGFDRTRSRIGQAVDVSGDPLRFEKTTNVIKLTMYGVIGLGIGVDLLLNFGSQPRWTALHLVSSGGFFLLMEAFINTDVTNGGTFLSSNFELLGPRQSGKTYATYGLYLAAHEADNVSIHPPNDPMTEFIEVQHPSPTDQENGYVDFQKSGNELGDLDEYEFDLVVERGQPKTVKVRTVDYRGENLPDVAKEVALSTDGGTDEEKNHESGGSSDTKSSGSTSEGIEVSLDEEESLDYDSEEDDEDSTESEKKSDEQSNRTYADVIDETDEILSQESEEPSEEPPEETEGAERLKDDDDITVLEETGTDGEEEDEDDVKTEADSEDEGDTDKLQQLKDKVGGNVKDSDKLIMILDIGRFMGETTQELSEELGTQPMNRIKRALPDKDIIFIATKADYYIEEWQEKEDYQGLPSRNTTRWKSFQETLSQELRDDPRVSPLMDGGLVYPVYYEVTEDGYIDLDDEGKIKHQGFTELLDVLVR